MPGSSDPIAQAEERHDSRIGALLAERYRIDALIDRGSMGRVYVGEHVLMHKRVAIKVLHRELTSVPEFVTRFEREARAAANIDSDHVVAATDFGKLPDGAVFLVLEFIEGKNLRDEITEGAMPVTRALHIGRQIASALASAHSLGIVHRDLKPENVMLVEKPGDEDFVKVLDFGIAKVPIGEMAVEEDGPSSRPITKAGMVFGTPEYMPPEQALGQDVDERADIYSLGVMIYEMLAGVRPFLADSQVAVLGQQLSRDAPPIRERAPGTFVPPPVERLVMRLLAREAKNRPQTARDVLDDIDKLLGYSPMRSRIPTLLTGTRLTDSNPPAASGQDLPTQRTDIPGLESPLQRLTDWVEARRPVLPAPLRGLPVPALLSVPFGVAGLFIGFLIVLLFSPAHHDTQAATAASASASANPSASAPSAVPEVASATPPPSASATSTSKAGAEELSAAATQGTDALEALERKYPNDAAVRLAMSAAALKNKDAPAAVQALAEALALSPELKDDGQVASALWILAQNKKSSARAFEILKGPMGDRGKSILRDLTTTPGVKVAVKAEAKRAL
jgi:serine/threonine-protein kinase